MGEHKDDISWMTLEKAAKKSLHMVIYVFDELFNQRPTLEDMREMTRLLICQYFHMGLLLIMELFL